MQGDEYEHIRAALQVLARAVSMQPGVDKRKLAQDIREAIPSPTKNLSHHLCNAMAHAAETGEIKRESYKPGESF